MDTSEIFKDLADWYEINVSIVVLAKLINKYLCRTFSCNENEFFLGPLRLSLYKTSPVRVVIHN